MTYFLNDPSVGQALIDKRVFVAIKEIYHEPKTAFWTGKVMDLLFNGFDVDCRSEDFNSKATCSVFESGEVKAVFPKGDEEDMFLFALFGGVIRKYLFKKMQAFLKIQLHKQANATDAGRFKTYRGVKNIHDLGKLIEFNGEPELEVWDGDACNEFRGTESSVLPPFMDKEEGIWAFDGDFFFFKF